MSKFNRTNGILLSITSLPSKYGIGDLGQESYNFVDLLTSFKARAWQILPLGPTGYGNSPYASRSTYAGNELLIDIDHLIQENLLPLDTMYEIPCFNNDRVDYSRVEEFKKNLLNKASENFINSKDHSLRKDYEKFVKENEFWLEDYSLYQALVDYYNDSRWYLAFDKDIANRTKEGLSKWKKKLKLEIEKYKVLQFFFYIQYKKLKEYANSKGIVIIGDLPIFVAMDSSDVWANTKLFKINKDGIKLADSGVPPDAFSSEGQKWGNPVYKWQEHKKDDYAWWKQRIKSELNRCDIIRIDHFRGFESYWEIPQDSSAKEGKWVKGPGQDFFDSLKKEFSNDLPFIAEDLGIITDKVNALREDNDLCGMKILQFAFEYKDGKLDSSHMYLPHNYDLNCICYTGTHDNDTTRGWYNSLEQGQKDLVRRYLQTNDDDVVWQMIRALFASRSTMVVTPLQDILGLDSYFRMNMPSTCSNSNWSYRFNKDHLQSWHVDRYREFVEFFNRDN